MKFICERSVLLKEIIIAKEIIVVNNNISILSNIYLEASNGTLFIKSTDIRVNFETQVPVTVIEEGGASVLGDKFLGILNTIPDGEIEFEQVDTRIIVQLKAKKVKFQLKTNPSEKYPPFPSSENETFIEFPIKDFKTMVSQTIFSVSDDQTRPFMNGIFVEKDENKLVMVATDGRRLSYIAKETGASLPDFQGIIVPVKIFSIVLKHAGDEGNVSIAFSDSTVFINFGSYHLSSQIIEGQYPNYRRVIPDNLQHSFTVNRQMTLEALRRVSILEEKTKRIYLGLKKDSITMYIEENDKGNSEEEFECQYDGEEARISLNHEYLEDPLKSIDTDEAVIRFTETSKAILIESVPKSDYFHIVMPMQEP